MASVLLQGRIAVVLAWAVLAAGCSGEPIDLVLDGVAAVPIVIPDNAVASVQQAAQELQYHVEQASGARLTIYSESGKPKTASGSIYLGNCQATGQAGISLEKLARNTFITKTSQGNLFLVGRDTAEGGERGTLRAVYDFLVRRMGVRWLWPGKLGEVIPKESTISIGSCDQTTTVPLANTRWRCGGINVQKEGWARPADRARFLAEQDVWLHRHGFSISGDSAINYGHAFTEYWDRFGQLHPEYFNLLPDGTRKSDPLYHGGQRSLVSLCVSEPRLWRQIVKDWGGRSAYINLNENDTSGRCTCEKCMAWDIRDPDLDTPWDDRLNYAKKAYAQGDRDWVRHLGSLTDRYAKFYLAVQKLAQQTDPDVMVAGLIYANLSKPPIATKLNDRIHLRFCPPIMFPWTDAKVQKFRRYWSDWSATGARLILRPNFTYDGHCFPIFVAQKVGECFSYAFKRGMVATDFDSLTGQYAAQGPNLYVLARMQQHGAMPVENVLNEYYQAFGPAEAHVREYFGLFEKISDAVTEDFITDEIKSQRPEGGGWSKFFVVADLIFTTDVMTQAAAILAKGEGACQGDDLAAERVVFLGKGLRNAQLTLDVQKAYRQFKKTGDAVAFAAAVDELDSYRASVEADHVANMGALAALEDRTWSRSQLKLLALPGTALPAIWKFMWDEENSGIEKGWHNEDFDDSAWLDIGTDAFWEKQPVGREWAKAHGGIGYDGFAWYRTGFEVKATDNKQEYQLAFGAVDEACKVWVNGKLVLDRRYPYQGDRDSWTKAFAVNVTEHLHFDRINVVSVQVEDNAGAGGIWRAVRLINPSALGTTQ